MQAKGVTTYFAVVIMFLMIAVAMGLTNVIYYQIKMTKDASDSVIAFQVTDSAVERGLYTYYKNNNNVPEDPGLRYPVDSSQYGEMCEAEGNCGKYYYIAMYRPTDKYKGIFAVGQYGKIKRALWVKWR